MKLNISLIIENKRRFDIKPPLINIHLYILRMLKFELQVVNAVMKGLSILLQLNEYETDP